MRPVADARPIGPSHGRPRRALWALCLTQITSWGILYYAFPVVNPEITATTGWSTNTTTAAFTLALVVSAFSGIFVGRVIDRRGPRAVMTSGSVLGGTSLVIIATAPSPAVFILGWFLAGPAMAATFYPPAFAALTRWWAPDHTRALTIVTLAGGLASTIFAPLTAALNDWFGWRSTYLALAVLLAAITVPAHAIALRAPWPPAPPPVPEYVDPTGIARTRTFAALVAALTLTNFAMYAVVVALVPLMLGRGFSLAAAALALGLGGAGQTVGRLFYTLLARLAGPRPRLVMLIASGAAATAALAAIPGPYVLVVTLSVAAGMVRGNLTLAQATAVTDRWGATHYGRLSGLLAALPAAAGALAPFASAVLATALGGYPHLFMVLAVVAAIGALAATRT
ncbi:MFS transporter [Streptomyces sp. RB110-1]|uniref:MFS transporter n=1 Tax=unclassified Streptomyces TaxID=2593676 RepID=UPI0019010798|nr:MULTISPECIES: MFS transporter [unclassified Streptomyces]MBK0372940.1 MFS transporter [Streptomyces sp. RB110-1]MBK0390692.1 MFS transporter [Streptomyces sp. RB110-2]